MKTLNRLLIANRGEIAVRIARTARRLGITTIAVCSDADRDAPHVTACDEFVPIGGQAPSQSYLDADKLLAAAVQSHAHAIHPGYGFLSENASFAGAVSRAGLIFVGPTADAVAAMGDKARARQRMAAAGIPVVPGYDGDDQQESRLLAEGERIGFPIMVKAAAGGGGRGMRLVAAAADLPAALRSAASEAAKAFGDGRLILERAIHEPRHVEIQVLADAHGHAIHLGERDCSVQRRHQKIVEESPSPAVDPVLRERMGQAAVAVARAIDYSGAGTVEFLLDASGQFFFMEMNTRLQVEHPVTELVTGLDLVEWQLRIAKGERLSLAQSDIALRGHAVEVRLCAEDPADDFMPRTGTVLDWRAGDHARCDHALAEGARISPWYDSMLAKIIVHGATRAEALDRLARAVDRTVLLGLPTNRAFLAQVLRHPVFAEGAAVSTAFISRCFAEPASRAVPPDPGVWALAAWLSAGASPESAGVPPHWRDWTNGLPVPRPWRLQWLAPASLAGAAETRRAGVALLGPGSARISCGAQDSRVRGSAVAPRAAGQVEIDDRELAYRYAWDDATLWLHTAAGDFAFQCQSRESIGAAGRTDATAGPEIHAGINARVLEVLAVPGAAVASGDRLVVLEAMKMEHEVRATRAGRVAAVNVRAGDQVVPGQWLVRLEGES